MTITQPFSSSELINAFWLHMYFLRTVSFWCTKSSLNQNVKLWESKGNKLFTFLFLEAVKEIHREVTCAISVTRALLQGQRRSNHGLSILMALSYYIQLIIGVGLVISFEYGHVIWSSYWWATGWPISRFPVFLMGVWAGLLCQRMMAGDQDAVHSKCH